jgi:hypothetical protein
MIRPRARWHHRLDRTITARDEANLVLLLDHEVRERCEREPRVLELREPTSRELHRRRRVEHQVHGELRLLLELLHVVAIELAVGLPVDVTELVALRVFLVLRELDGAAVHRRAMHARKCALDDHARLDRQAP